MVLQVEFMAEMKCLYGDEKQKCLFITYIYVHEDPKIPKANALLQ